MQNKENIKVWYKLSVTTTETKVIYYSDILEEYEASSVSIVVSDEDDNLLIVSGMYIQKEKLELCKKHLTNIINHNEKINIEELPDREWVTVWQDNYQPICIEKKLWIYPSWQEVTEDLDLKYLIKMDPGLAFGSGSHETTYMCLKWLVNNQEKIKDKLVIDYGCGSGILAIAALKLGAKKVIAVDIEEQALSSTRDNAKNNMLDLEHLEVTSPDKLHEIKADVIVANILAEPLISLADEFNKLMHKNTILVLSGLLNEQANKVIAHYQPISLEKQQSMNEWALLSNLTNN